jgi:hypothetical protein
MALGHTMPSVCKISLSYYRLIPKKAVEAFSKFIYSLMLI